MTAQNIPRATSTLSILVVTFLMACGDTTSPGVEPEIVNTTDSFEFQISDVADYTNTLQYSWQNTGTTANVDQATSGTGGSMTVTILDADGTEVYSRSLADNGTFVTTSGTAGNWTIRVGFNSASGTVNFRVQKRT